MPLLIVVKSIASQACALEPSLLIIYYVLPPTVVYRRPRFSFKKTSGRGVSARGLMRDGSRHLFCLFPVPVGFSAHFARDSRFRSEPAPRFFL